jgi:thioredoxin reductase
MSEGTVYDVLVIGAGPAGSQAAISAAHQMRHVLVLDAGAVSNRKGRAYWSKSVEIEDAPVFPGITGPRLMKELRRWLEAHPVHTYRISGELRLAGIEIRAGMAMSVARVSEAFAVTASTRPLLADSPLETETFYGRTLVVASGFEDCWPDIEVDQDAVRWVKKYQKIFRYAGNQRGWHVCIRCDGHLHVDQHLALLGTGDTIYDAAIGAQDFTNHITILTNGRPHGFTPSMLSQLKIREIDIIEKKIASHIGKGTELLGVRFDDGSEQYFDGFLVDEGLEPNTGFLKGWDIKTNSEGLLVVDEDNQVLDQHGSPIPGLYAAGDVVSGSRKLIAAALASGQNAGLAASDSLRLWR